MGKAKRRKARAAAGKDEGRSLWELDVYAASDIPGIIDQAMAGDKGCTILARIVAQISERLFEPDKAGSLPHCVLCPQTFAADGEAPQLFGIMRSAARRGPMLAHLVCESCSNLPDLRARLFEAVRRDIASDVREVFLHEPGHA